MRKNSTFGKLAGRLCALAVLAAWAVSSFAGSSSYHYFWAKMETLPSGKGLVYADTTAVEEVVPDFQETQDYKFMADALDDDPSTTFNVWVKPAEGYLFSGWSSDGETLIAYDGTTPTTLTVTAKTEGRADGIDLPMFYPLEPDSTYYAMFARVVTRYVPGEEDLGKIEISKVLNDVGDEITLTGTPNYDNCSFAYWTDSKGNRITDNPLVLTVSEAETYTAHFDCDSAYRFTFPEEGGYILWSSPKAAYLAGNMNGNVVYSDSIVNGNVNLLEYGFSVNANQGYLLYGEGECTITYYDDPYASFLADDLLISSGENGVSIDTLSTKGKSYFLYQGGRFVRATEGFVEPWTAYLAVPDTCNVTADVLTINGGSLETGIEDVKADAKKASAKVQGVYDLAGRRLMAPGKDGIYIIDGKKVLYRKK